MDVTMVKNAKKLAHCGIGENYPWYSLSTIIVGAIHVGDSTLRESPLPFPVSFNPIYATGGMILVILREKKLE